MDLGPDRHQDLWADLAALNRMREAVWVFGSQEQRSSSLSSEVGIVISFPQNSKPQYLIFRTDDENSQHRRFKKATAKATGRFKRRLEWWEGRLVNRPGFYARHLATGSAGNYTIFIKGGVT